VICFSGVIDPGESKNPYAAPRKLTRDSESPPVEINAKFQTNLFGNVNTPFNSIFRADSESGLGFPIGRETGRELVNSHFLINFTKINCYFYLNSTLK